MKKWIVGGACVLATVTIWRYRKPIREFGDGIVKEIKDGYAQGQIDRLQEMFRQQKQ